MVGRYSDFRIFFVVLLALAAMCGSQRAFALGTSREAQIGGFIHASLETIITGEFAGRTPSNADAQPTRPICRPNDYDDLRATAKDNAALDAFRRRCKVVEVKTGETHVVGTAYLPAGYCAALKQVYDDMLAKHVYGVTSDWLEVEYKGSRYSATRGNLARRAQLQTACHDDGSLSITAPRKRR